MATSPADENDPMSNRYIPREARAVPHEEVVHTIEFRKITYPLTDRPAELWIVETNHRGHKHFGVPWNDFWMISLLPPWEPLRTTPWPAVLTSKPLHFNGVNITMFLILFLTEVHLNFKNFGVTSYLNKLIPILLLKVHTHPFPTNNHCYGLAGAAPHFATPKATLL